MAAGLRQGQRYFKARCRMHGGAKGSGGPSGPRNGNFKHERKARADRRVLATAISSMASRHPRVSVSAPRRKLREVSSRDKARGAVTRTYGPKSRTPRRCGEPFGRPTNTIRTSSHSIVRRYMCAALLPPTSAEFAVIEKGGTPALRSTMPFCTSMAQRTASTRCETQRWLHRRCA
jgi:hypothetical protein